MTFDKQSLLKMFAPKVVPIRVEWDGKVMEMFARELSAAQVFELQAKQKADKDDPAANGKFTLALLSQALCDEQGKSVVTEKDVQELAQMQVKAFGQLAEAVSKAVGLAVEKPAEGKEAAPNA